MKMKSKFLGFNAMAALALLAAGSMFTSCYDTENGDVIVPYVTPDPVYIIVGQVVDAITGYPVDGASIAISGAITGSTTTDENGDYQIRQAVKGGARGTVTVKADKGGKTIDGDITVDMIANGETAVYTKNLRLNPPTFDDSEVRVKVTSTTSERSVVLQGEDPEGEGTYVPALDLINNTASPVQVTEPFLVDEGAMILTPTTRAATRTTEDDLDAFALSYITEDLGQVPSHAVIEENYTIEIPPKSGLQSITITYKVENLSYTFTYGNEVVMKSVERILSRKYTPSFADLNIYHGHGHGHGHGGANAGGGIWE
jgi:hypothetical protein